MTNKTQTKEVTSTFTVRSQFGLYFGTEVHDNGDTYITFTGTPNSQDDGAYDPLTNIAVSGAHDVIMVDTILKQVRVGKDEPKPAHKPNTWNHTTPDSHLEASYEDAQNGGL